MAEAQFEQRLLFFLLVVMFAPRIKLALLFLNLLHAFAPLEQKRESFSTRAFGVGFMGLLTFIVRFIAHSN